MTQVSGKLVVLTGPSGVGKGTLRGKLLEAFPDIVETVSATTRNMRPGETEGCEYYFVSHERFQQMISENELVEWAEYAGNFYGTPKQQLQDLLLQHDFVLMEIEVKGALQIKQLFPEAKLVFIAPPSLDALEQRIRGRNTNNEDDIQRRLEVAKSELAQQNQFDCVVINADLEETTQELIRIIQ